MEKGLRGEVGHDYYSELTADMYDTYFASCLPASFPIPALPLPTSLARVLQAAAIVLFIRAIPRTPVCCCRGRRRSPLHCSGAKALASRMCSTSTSSQPRHAAGVCPAFRHLGDPPEAFVCFATYLLLRSPRVKSARRPWIEARRTGILLGRCSSTTVVRQWSTSSESLQTRISKSKWTPIHSHARPLHCPETVQLTNNFASSPLSY